jgi:hypothetical protein
LEKTFDTRRLEIRKLLVDKGVNPTTAKNLANDVGRDFTIDRLQEIITDVEASGPDSIPAVIVSRLREEIPF